MKILVDSSVILESLKDNRLAVELLEKILDYELFISPVVFDEVVYVVRKRTIKEVKDVITFLLESFYFLPIDHDVVRKASIFILKYNLKPADALILATCKHHSIKYLATLDEDFIKPAKKEKIKLLMSRKDVEKI